MQGTSCINLGISGQTTAQMLLRFNTDVLALQPAGVLVLAGRNDIDGNTGPMTLKMIQKNIFSMVELAKAHQIKVILCSVLPAGTFYWNSQEKPANRIVQLNKSIENYAEANNIPYVEFYSSMADDQKGLPACYSNNEVHPNKTGYQVTQPLIENALSLILLNN